MKQQTCSRILSVLLVLVMVLSMIPTMVFAEETVTYTKITTAEELVTGKYVMVVSTGYGPGVLDGTWVTAVQPVTDGEVTNDTGAVWTITVDGTTAKLTDSNGTTIAPPSGNTNGIASGDYSWVFTCTDGTFRFSGTGDDTTTLASNKSSSNKFRAYKNATVSGTPASYPSDFTLYKQEVSAKDITDMTPTVEGTVAPGALITLKCEAESAAFEVSTDNENWTAIEGSTYTIPQGTVGENLVYIRAALDGKYSKTLILKYFVEGYRKITSASELVTGKYVMVVSTGYGPGVLDGTWVTAVQPVTDGEVTNDTGAVWTITVDGSTAKLTDSNGTTIAPPSGNTNGIASGDYSWVFTCTDGMFRFSGTGEDTTTLASNKSSSNKFRAYKNATVSGTPASYPCDFTLYLFVKDPSSTELEAPAVPTASVAAGEVEAGTVVTFSCATAGAVIQYHTGDGNWVTGSQVTVNETMTYTVRAVKDGVESNTASFTYTVKTGESSDISTIAEVRAGGTGKEVTVKGVVLNDYTSAISSLGCYIQDATGGIMLFDKTMSSFQVGDVVKVTGTTSEYKGKFELTGVTAEVLETGASVTPETITIADFNTPATAEAKEGTLVSVKKLTVSAVSTDSYNNVTLTLTSGEATMQAKLDSRRTDPAELAALEVGTVVDVVGIIESNGSNEAHLLQLRTPADVTEASVITDPISDDMIGEGVLNVKQANESTATGVSVVGQVVYIYGSTFNGAASLNSIILEDVIDGEIYGFQVYDYANYADYKVGDVVKVTGDITLYGGVKQMKSPAMEVVMAGLEPIAAQEITVSQMGADYLSEYVTIKNVTLGTYNGTGNTPVTDATGTVNLYKGAPLPTGAAEADVIALYGCCSAFNGTYQLRNGTESDYVTNLPTPDPDEGLPSDGDQVMLYNANAKGVLSLQDDNVESPSITGVSAEVVDGKAVSANGGLTFTVEKNGEYYRFWNETFGYLCSNGTGNNAFYSLEATEDADWTVTECNGGVGGFDLESRTAKYKGYGQWLEYYSDSYKTYSMDPNKVTDYTIYSFFFYPCGNEASQITGGVVNAPAVDFGVTQDAYLNQDYTLTFTVDAVFGVKDLQVKLGEDTVGHSVENGVYTVVIPGVLVVGESLTVTVTGTDNKDTAFTGTATIAVLDEPVISNLTPAAGSQTLEEKRPVISAEVSNAGENPTITMTVNGEKVETEFKDGVVSYTPDEDMEDGTVVVKLTVERVDGKKAEKSWRFTVGKARYQLYFGQLHSHTTYSDGSGSLESALEYVANLPKSANVDFVAFTDHSNYFDTTSAANPEGALYDMSLASESSQKLWNEYKSTVAAFNESQSDIVAVAGFEMTWSGGPGHINTFNTPGIVSRNNSTLNNKTSDAGMKAYYALLCQPEGADSLSQFNHPGSTFGTFSDFAYWDALIDSRIFLVEVGNGEGQIGAGGYYPSYEYYTMALDKGWHVAPTNNQDNHKGKWGNANDARDVILTDDFSENGIYNAIRALRVYATEDKNLEITYNVNGLLMGSSIVEVPEKLTFNVTVNDPDGSDSISKVEIIVNSGKTAYTWSDPAELAAGSLTAELDPEYSYYYIRVTESDGDLAVTAPVWVGESLKLGISSVTCGTSTPVTGEELTLTTTLFNSQSSGAAVKTITYQVKGGEVLGADSTGYTVPASGTLAVDFKYTPAVAKVSTITVTVVMELDGKEYTFSKDIELDVQDSDKLVYIGIDASHHNEYVAGNYSNSMGNFGALAAGYSVRTVELKTSEDLIAACGNEKFKAIVLTAPSRRDGTALRDPYDTYSDAEVDALAAFNKAGGTVVLCGWGDYYESYSPFPAEDHMAAQQNKILASLGSSIRISDDETKDNTWNGGQAQRLYLSTYNFDSFLLDGVEYDAENPHNNLYTELYSQYGGASIYIVDGSGNPMTTVPATVTPVVYGFDTTYSSDDDKDSYGGLGSIPKYSFDDADRLMVMATEQLPGQGLIVVSGAAFLSNFEVQATIEDSGSEKNYSNYKICENLLKKINPVNVTDIAEVRSQTEAGYKYTIEGVVTSNASGYDKDTAFFDCIYVQDETGGICCFPVSGNYKVGDKVRVTGTTDFYQGEPELQVSSITVIGEGTVEPTPVTAAQISNRSAEGKLVTISGTVESFEIANDLVQTIMVKDEAGDVARIFIDGYITTSKDVENLAVGCDITATGCASYDNTFNAPDGPFPRIRIRNRADVICTGTVEHTHSFGDWEVTKAATCTEDGLKTRRCSCGATETETIEASGHSWGEWTTTKEATCTKDGEQQRQCSSCQATETRKVAATGHSWSDWKVTKNATTSSTGLKTRTCSVCGEKEEQVIPKLSLTPGTGDDMNLGLWIGLMVVALIGICAIVIVLIKKRKK